MRKMLSLLMLLTLLAAPCAAQENDLSIVPVDWIPEDGGFYSGVWVLLDGGVYAAAGYTEEAMIVVPGEEKITLILDGVQMDLSDSPNVSPIEFSMGAELEIVLADGSENVLRAGNSYNGGAAGIHTGEGKLRILCESVYNGEESHVCDDNCGTLAVYGGNEELGDSSDFGSRSGAGIGGGYPMSIGGMALPNNDEQEYALTGSNITIDGGNITAYAGFGAAGIGGAGMGEDDEVDTSARNITINGGNVKAYSDGFGAGIGGGRMGSAENIAINGGDVLAESGREGEDYSGAAIGAGADASAKNITISGGKVQAFANFGGAGIGGGDGENGGGSGSSITISGGEVTAVGFWDGAGIGGGYMGRGKDITITGGKVEAGGVSGAGIGGGAYSEGKNITITGGSVEAASNGAQGIGHGNFGYEGYADGAGELYACDSVVIDPASGTRIGVKAGSEPEYLTELEGSPFELTTTLSDQIADDCYVVTNSEKITHTAVVVQPHTGDGSMLALWAALGMAGAAGMMLMRRKNA